MKKQPTLHSMTVDYETFHALTVGRQRYLLVSADIHLEGGDFIEIVEGRPAGITSEREPNRCVLQATDASVHPRQIDPDYQVVSVARVTDVALRLRYAIPA